MSCRPKRTDVQNMHEELVYKRFLSIRSKSYENNVFWLYRTRFMLDELGSDLVPCVSGDRCVSTAVKTRKGLYVILVRVGMPQRSRKRQA